MTVDTQQLPELSEQAEGLREMIPLGRGEVYQYPASGLGDLVLGGRNLPNRFAETGILAFRNKHPHPRYGDRIIARRLDNLPFALVRFTWPNLEDITRRTHRYELRTNHLALRVDGDTPELPATPEVQIVSREGIIEFWGDILGQLRTDFGD